MVWCGVSILSNTIAHWPLRIGRKPQPLLTNTKKRKKTIKRGGHSSLNVASSQSSFYRPQTSFPKPTLPIITHASDDQKRPNPIIALYAAHIVPDEPLIQGSRRATDIASLSEDLSLALAVIGGRLVAPAADEVEVVDGVGGVVGGEFLGVFVEGVGVGGEGGVPEGAARGVVFDEAAGEVEARDGMVVCAG